jgi:arsenate reductase
MTERRNHTKTMVENPILIGTPIVINGDKAIIGRDLEKLTVFYNLQ